MKLIAHRGMFEGPNKNKENLPDQIGEALFRGFDVEIDAWYINDEWWLGHDEPTYKVNYKFINLVKAWIHCKNLEALSRLSLEVDFLGDFFWHQNDDHTLTYRGYIWTYPGKPLTPDSICVMPEWVVEPQKFKENCWGVCSDYVGLMDV